MSYQKDFLKLPLLPDNIEVFRASGLCRCEICNIIYYDHPKFRYGNDIESGTVVLGCDGRYYHL